MPKQFTLAAKERLKSRKRIEALFSSGKKFHAGPCRVFWQKEREGDPLVRLGVGVSTRHFKKATDRNRIKRLIRESWRLQKNNLQISAGSLDVFVIYTDKQLPVFTQTNEWISLIIHKLQTLNPV